MRWTSVAWACCLLPVLAGCGTMSRVMHGASGAGVTNDTGLPHARRASEDDTRRGARTAWETVRTQHPQRGLSDEFRDGFVDGYADFLDRGNASQPPAVPPVPYERYKKFFGRGGHGLVRDYYLGFNYGAEVAVTTGHRPAPTSANAPGELATRPGPPKTPDLPLLRPVSDAGKFGEPKASSDAPPLRDKNGKAIPPLPKPEIPIIQPFNPDLTGGGKFAPLLVPSDPDRLPMPYPPLPVAVEPRAVPLEMPAPPAPTLSVLDKIPVIPLQYPPPK